MINKTSNMKEYLNAEFNFHPIGQGCFYTGKIYKYNNSYDEFNFVFDCGTKSDRTNILNAIEKVKERYSKKCLDVLVLSHLDDDHVNCVKELLTDVLCKRIYIPYLTPIQRLFVAIKNNPKDTFNPNDFFNFIISPHDYLLSIEGANIEKVIYVFGNQEGNFLSEEDFPREPIDPEKLDFKFKDSLENVSKENYPDEIKEANNENLNKVEFKKGNNTLNLGLIWEFYLYNIQADENKILQFESEIKKILKIDTTDSFNNSHLKSLLSNEELIKRLRKVFKDIFKDLNKTGLLVQHKPLGYRAAKFVKDSDTQFYFPQFDPNYQPFLRKNYSNYRHPVNYKWGVTLLTGDICLNQIQSSTYVEVHLKNVLVFQIPHHGSETGWEFEYLNNLNNKGMTSAIINFGFGNTYGHPKPNVIVDLVEENFDIHFCNQFDFFRYFFNLQF